MQVFESAQKMREEVEKAGGDFKVSIQLSLLEIYNEQFRDLLHPNATSEAGSPSHTYAPLPPYGICNFLLHNFCNYL